jgi:hypothetical protein
MEHVAYMVRIRNSYNILVGKPEGKRLLGRPRHKWEDNVKIKPMEMKLEVVDWNHLEHDRDHLTDSCEHINELLSSAKHGV